MRAIAKGCEPRSLTEHRASLHADYANYAAKDELRAAIVRDQRGLCCYCMGRIRPNGAEMKIAHWRSQTRYPDEQLSFRNLLGACKGGEGQAEQHCDSKQADRDLKFNPADPAHRIEQLVQFRSDGTIASCDREFDRQLNEVLNLNLSRLKGCRKAVLAAVLQWWKRDKERRHGRMPRELIQRELDRRAAAGAGELSAFEPVATWWLNHCLDRGAA